jgi:hypothetical protein
MRTGRMQTRSVEPVLLARQRCLRWWSIKDFSFRLRMTARSKCFSPRMEQMAGRGKIAVGVGKDASGRQENSQKGGNTQGEL